MSDEELIARLHLPWPKDANVGEVTLPTWVLALTAEAADRIEELEAKLAKAIEVIDNAATLVEDRHFLYMNLSGRDPKNCSSDLSLIAEEIRLASTKLKGQDYE